MPARDKIHNLVKEALTKDGWEITDDPYVISYGERFLFIDLAATDTDFNSRAGKFIGAKKGKSTIAIEIKEFRNQSPIVDLEQAVGQYIIYQLLLKETDPQREIYLAIPSYAYNEIFREPLGKLVIENLPLKLIVIELKTKEVKEWIPQRPPEK